MRPEDAVFEDAALLAAVLAKILRARLLPALGGLACADRRLRDAAEVAVRAVVWEVWPKAHRVASEPWVAHWVLVSAVQGNPNAREALAQALYAKVTPGHEMPRLAATHQQLAWAERAVTALVKGCGKGRPRLLQRLLGRPGGRVALPLQRRLLQRLCLQAGALRQAPALARIAVQKFPDLAEEEQVDVLLDLAEVLNVRAYMRTYVSRERNFVAELEDALLAAQRARGLAPSVPRARRLLGRTLASAAHALMLGAMEEETEERFLQQWGGGPAMFQAAVEELQASAGALRAAAATRRAASDALELGATVAALGECWFCVAAAAEHGEQMLLGLCAHGAAAYGRDILKESIGIFASAGLVHTVEHADALKDLGKLLDCFGQDDSGQFLLTAAMALHEMLLGDRHPRTRNILRLMDD